MDDEIDLRQYTSILWRRRYTVIAVTVAAIAAALLVNLLSPRVYESEALIQLSEHSAPLYASPASAASVITSPDFLDAVADATGLGESGRKLQRLVKVEPVRDTRMVRVNARYTSPEQAQRLTGAVADTFISGASERVRDKRKTVEARLNSVNAQLLEIQRILRLARETLSRLQQGRALSEADRGFVRSFTLNTISVSAALYSGLLDAQKELVSNLLTMELPTLVQKPSRPIAPIAPRKVFNVSLAAILGLMAGTMLAFVMEYFGAPTGQPAPSRATPAASNPSHRGGASGESGT